MLKPENQDRLMDIITYHVIPGKYLSRTMRSETIITVEGKPITIQVDNDVIRVNKAKIIKADLVGPNGVVHEIDTLLIP